MGVGEESTLLRQLFQAAGYRVNDHPRGWTAVRARDRRSVVFSEEVISPVELEATFLSDALHRVLIYPSDPGPVARSLASERGIEVFDLASIGATLGELLLFPEPPSDSGGGSVPLEAPPAIFPEGLRVVRERLSQEQAEEIAAAPDLRPTIRLVPFYVGPYRVRRPSPHGGMAPSSEHVVAVNALLRTVEGWDPSQYELDPSGAAPHPLLEPTVTVEEARGIALAWIRSRNTVRVEHTEQHGGAVVVETRRLPPSTEDVRLAPLALVYVPFWYFEGEGGRLVIDAVTGRARAPTPAV